MDTLTNLKTNINDIRRCIVEDILKRNNLMDAQLYVLTKIDYMFDDLVTFDSLCDKTIMLPHDVVSRIRADNTVWMNSLKIEVAKCKSQQPTLQSHHGVSSKKRRILKDMPTWINKQYRLQDHGERRPDGPDVSKIVYIDPKNLPKNTSSSLKSRSVNMKFRRI